MENNYEDRKSEAESAELIKNDIDRAKAEIANGLRQFDFAMEELDRWKLDKSYKLKQSLLLKLNRIALIGVHEQPGVYRSGKIKIRGSGHQPPPAEEVPGLVEEFCDYINDNWERKSPIHLAAYSMWKLNWIHPFSDGNGRTSRMISYLILCAKIGNQIPGSKTIPEQIVENKKPYYDALEAADRAFDKGKIDVSEMEQRLHEYLASQLVEIHMNATGDVGISIEDKSIDERKHGIVKVIENHPVISTSIVTVVLFLLGLIFVS